MTDKPATAADMVEATRKYMEGMESLIVRPNEVLIGERAYAALLRRAGQIRRAQDVHHFETPKPLGKRAKRRSRGKKS